jgi:hypothetical protein
MIRFIGTAITITINYNSWQSVTVCDRLRSLLNYECLLFCVTDDVVPIYKSVTTSASAVRRLTLHSWTLNSLTTERFVLLYTAPDIV